MGEWSGWKSVEGTIISAPSVASRVPSKMTVVARGPKNRIVARSWNEGQEWADWNDLGGSLTYDPAIVAGKSDRYTVYAVGGKQVIYRKSWIEGSNWPDKWAQTNETTQAWGGVAAAAAGEGRIDLLTVNNVNAVLHATAPIDQPWGSFSSIGGTINGTAAVSWATGRVDLFARGANSNKMYHRVLNGSTWGTWREIGTGFISGPGAATWGPDRLDVFAKGHDHQILHRFWNGSQWSEWIDLGITGTDDAPAAVSRRKGNIELFIRGRDNKLYHRTYTADDDELDDAGTEDAS